jgi:simple sugar transport system permease protein
MTWMVFAQFIDSAIRASAPIVLAALGAVFAFRAGIFFLGLEGLMLIGAFAGVAGTKLTGSVALGVSASIIGSMIAAGLYWIVIVPLKANQIIAGLGLSILGLGLTSFGLLGIFGSRGAIYVDEGLWRPVRGQTEGPLALVTDLSILVWMTPLIVFICWIILSRSRFGLRITAVGEYPFAARSAGFKPGLVRLQVLVICGVLCGLAGAELSLGALRSFTENLTQGLGFIAFTAAVFGAAMPIGAAMAGLFFGAASALGIQTQLLTEGIALPRELVLAVPYLLTIAAVWFASVRRSKRNALAGFGELRDD